MDFAPGLLPSLHVLRDPGCNVAYWNLPSRHLRHGKEGYEVDGRPLRFFHFTGFDPAQPDRLSKHQDRIDLARHPALRELCHAYAQALEREGHSRWRARQYAWDALPDGTLLDSAARRVYRDGAKSGDLLHRDVFTAEGCEAFLTYLRAPASQGGKHGVSRYLHAVWAERDDLRQAFPNLGGADGPRLVAWASREGGLQPALAPHAGMAGRPTVNLAGYFAGVMGTGEHARQLAAALRTQRIPLKLTTLHPEAAPEDARLAADDAAMADLDTAFNLLAVNADSVEGVAAQLGRDFFAGRYTIGFWAWEVSAFPRRFLSAMAHLDEVWVGSRHVRDAIAPLATVPVIAIPQPVSLPAPKGDGPRFELPGSFNFLFAFDYLSVFERKNAVAAVQAFTKAFPAGSGAALTVKCLNTDFDSLPTLASRPRRAATRMCTFSSNACHIRSATA